MINNNFDMEKNLVIVESPAKAKTIEKFLGKDYKVLSSYGHIRDLKKKKFSIDVQHDFTPEYEIPAEKKKLVAELKKEADKADTVWLASDEDREGEAISWHLYEVLGLKPEHTKRIVFHEITKDAIKHAVENPRNIDINLVNAQQARRMLDRIVGFELSPVLWKKVKPALSAGRVQSVAVRLIVEREREIAAFRSEPSFKVTAIFIKEDNGKTHEIKAELDHRFKNEKEAADFIESIKGTAFTIEAISRKPLRKIPAPPFTTSTLQQEAARKLGFTVAQTMRIAQSLYEDGKITYMRTDSVNLSDLAINTSRAEIISLMGEKYAKTRHFQTKTKGAQEAHEAIRPTYMNAQTIDGTAQEKKLYALIWKRTIASQMADAEIEKTVADISIAGHPYRFQATGEVIMFNGFLKVYQESHDDDRDNDRDETVLPPLKQGESLARKEVTATQRFTQHPPRYTEASLVKRLEELGIGRPSTYAPTIQTIQQREYVTKGDKPGEERKYTVIKLDDKGIRSEEKTETSGSEKGKLIPTDVGIVVNDFLTEYFPEILSYNFTADVEKQFDEVAEGHKEWKALMKDFYDHFHPSVESAMSVKSDHKVGERILGEEPGTGKKVSVKIGRFGPVVQIGSADETEKPKFAQLRAGQSLESLTLEEALDLFKLPRTVGQYEDKTISVGTGRFGPYIRFADKFISIPKTMDPLEISLDDAVALINAKREADAKKSIKTFAEDPELEILNGRYGPYIAYKKKNYKLPKDSVPAELTHEECMQIIAAQEEKGTVPKRKKASAKSSK